MKHLKLMILCDDPESAQMAENAGIDRILVKQNDSMGVTP